MRIDLHTHSDRSDGTDPPGALLRKAKEAGLDVVALTDHDTTVGWADAAQEAASLGIGFVPGIEVSTRHAGQGVHLLAYLPDPEHAGLVAELDRVLEGRGDRLPRILARLREIGIEIGEDDVRRLAGDAAALGRPHVADALVAAGHVTSRDQAFAELLGPGGPAYVDRYAADLVTMIGTVADAGGVTVLAHPWAERHTHDALDADGLAGLRDAGLAGVEVDHEDHPPGTRERLRALARELDLVVTGSSDHHGLGKVGHRLGCNTTAPEEYERLMELAQQAAARAGRSAATQALEPPEH